MILPTRPTDDARRVDELRHYDVLDTLPEQALDDITALAAHICDAPTSLISLIDDERQWFKSRFGFPLTETPRDVSFCGHAILGRDLLVVSDAAADERFADNPLVTGEPCIRFYAGAPLIAEEGHVLGTLCIIDRVPRDLTPSQREALWVLSRQVMSHLEMRRKARELAESEARLVQVFLNCPVALSVHRWRDRTFVDINAAYTDLLGWTRDDVVGRTPTDLGIVEAQSGLAFRSLLAQSHSVRDQELMLNARDGTARHVIMGMQLVELHGEMHAITTFVDITTRKQGDAASRRLAAIVTSSDDAIIGKDLNGIVTDWNSGAEALFGYPAAEMIGAPIMRLIPMDRRDEETLILDRIQRGLSVDHFETVRQSKDGQRIDVSITASPIRDASGATIGVSKVARNIGRRKHAEAARRESEGRYRALFDYAPDGILIADPQSIYLDANASMCNMLGYSREELVGLHGSAIVVPDEVANIAPALDAIKADDDYHREWRFQRKDGSAFTADVIAAPMPDGNLLAMVRDVTERKRNDARFRRLVNSNVQGVMFWNTAGRVTGANDAFLSVVGYSRAELEAGEIEWSALTPPEYDAADARCWAETRATGVCTPFEKELYRKDGSRVAVLVGTAAFEDDPDEGVCFVLDLTERKKLEHQFLRAQRMESLGTLAGGVAHDLNNVLTPILMAVGLLKDEIADTSLIPLLDTLETSAKRGGELVRQVLTFARGVEGTRVIVKPVALIRELLKVMRDTFPKSIDVRFASPRDLWTVTGDPTQLHQVLLNLCVNARDAMPDGGHLTVTAANVVLDQTYAAMNIDARASEYVLVTVADSGTGITPEVKERIFEPFFTTKGIGNGTGLGLSTTLAIVKSHGGFINVYSELRNGTTFKVYLPANTAPQSDDARPNAAPPLPRGHGELILVIDDEEAIRAIAKSTLERFGYRVLLAANGAEAVGLYAVHRSEIAVILTDMAMPVMDGPATVVALQSIDPSVRVIGSSGLTSVDGMARATSVGIRNFVPKPYTAEAILTAIQRALRSPD